MLSTHRLVMPANWRKSRRSGQQGNCVEVAGDGACVAVRDTQDREGPVLAVPAAAWRSFARSLSS